MSPTTQDIVVETLTSWAEARIHDGAPPRRNYRLVLGDGGVAGRVAETLAERSGRKAWFVVRSSFAPDAVLLRNQRPAERPAGVEATTPLIYLVFWDEADDRHHQNAQSLRDLATVDTADVLGSDTELALEAKMAARCLAAAEIWQGKAGETCRRQLGELWRVVRDTIRTGRGGREGTLPFVDRLEAYAEWLLEATLADDAWASLAPAYRPAALVRAWGEALPKLHLFRLPALASVLGTCVSAEPQAARKEDVAKWRSRFRELLSENQAAAADFTALDEQIAGRTGSAEARLKGELAGVPLSQDDPDGARKALVRFCRGDDADALGEVEWLFYEERNNRRSTSFGMKGVLIARRSSTKVSPDVRAGDALHDVLVAACEGDADAQASAAAAAFAEALRARVKGDGRHAAEAAALIRRLAAGESPEVPWADASARTVLLRVAQAPARDAGCLEQVADQWQKLGDIESSSVDAPDLLLGLARLCARVLAQRNVTALGGNLLVLSSGDAPRLELQLDAWTDDQRQRLATWLRDRVLPAVIDEDPDEAGADSEAEDQELEVEVALRGAGGGLDRLGQVTVTWTTLLVEATRESSRLAAWAMSDPEARRFRGADLLAALAHQKPVGHLEPVEAAFESYHYALTQKPHAALAHVLGPAPREARGWVEAWSRALAPLESGAVDQERRRKALEEERDRAIEAEDLAGLKRIQAELKALDAAPTAQLPSQDAVRALLRVGTAEIESGGARRLVLLPHHPLVLRQRLVAEELLCACLHTMTSGWPAEALADLSGMLDGWAAPEPQHLYGWWDGDPLVFDEWIAAYRLALFRPFEVHDGADVARQGLREAGRVLDRYTRLFPAALDRLSLRVHADAEGRWALRLMDQIARGDGPDGLAADLDVRVDVPASSFARESWGAPERRALLELHDDGTPPVIRLRALDATTAPAHVAFVVGETVAALEPHLDRMTPRPPEGEVFAPSVLFEAGRPELLEKAFFIADPPDPLCRRVAIAVSYARNEQVQVHVERYGFDETRVREPVRELHRGAHWLVLGSRRPLYRAVQAAGEEVATLLDFRTTWDAGRQLHVCVSISAGDMKRDLERLGGLLRSVLGKEIPGLAERLVERARRFAPGFAINCAGAPSANAVKGLLGLLLTAEKVRETRAGALVLALDQHQLLLSRGRDESRGDILSLWQEDDGGVALAVAESKLTVGVASPADKVATDARAQVKRSFERLRRLTAVHPLSPRVRAEVRAAITEHVHLAAATRAEAEAARPLFDRIASPACPLRLALAAGEVHVWSLYDATAEQKVVEEDCTVFVHGRSDTLARLERMAR